MSGVFLSGRKLDRPKPIRAGGRVCRCGGAKETWMLFCAICWCKIPAELRKRIMQAKARCARDEFRALIREALDFIGKAKEAA